jgi:hypothetical protein
MSDEYASPLQKPLPPDWGEMLRNSPYHYELSFFCHECQSQWSASTGPFGIEEVFARWNENHARHEYSFRGTHRPLGKKLIAKGLVSL